MPINVDDSQRAKALRWSEVAVKTVYCSCNNLTVTEIIFKKNTVDILLGKQKVTTERSKNTVVRTKLYPHSQHVQYSLHCDCVFLCNQWESELASELLKWLLE